MNDAPRPSGDPRPLNARREVVGVVHPGGNTPIDGNFRLPPRADLHFESNEGPDRGIPCHHGYLQRVTASGPRAGAHGLL
jgi:hypothetical protein